MPTQTLILIKTTLKESTLPQYKTSRVVISNTFNIAYIKTQIFQIIEKWQEK